MGINTVPKQPVAEKAAQLQNDAELGHASELVLKVLDPLIERRLGALLDQFSQAPPELGAMLDLRAKISEVWFIRRTLKTSSLKGKGATEIVRKILMGVREPDVTKP